MLDTMTNEEFLHYLEYNPEVDILNLTYDEQQQLLRRFKELMSLSFIVDSDCRKALAVKEDQTISIYRKKEAPEYTFLNRELGEDIEEE